MTIFGFLAQAMGQVSNGSDADGCPSGEHTLLRQLMHVFMKEDIVIADTYYASCFLVAMLIKMGVAIVIFEQGNVKKCDNIEVMLLDRVTSPFLQEFYSFYLILSF